MNEVGALAIQEIPSTAPLHSVALPPTHKHWGLGTVWIQVMGDIIVDIG